MNLTLAPAAPAASAFFPSIAFTPATPSSSTTHNEKASANARALAQSVALLLPASEARACERLHAISTAWAADGPATVVALRDRLRAHCERFEALEGLATESARRATEARCEQTYALSKIRITRMPPRYPLLQRAAPRPLEAGTTAELQLRLALVRHFRVTMRQGEPHFGALQRTVLRFLRRRQAILRIVATAQRTLDLHLGAGAGNRAFGGLLGNPAGIGASRDLPDLYADLQSILDLKFTVDTGTLDIADRQ
jgi:hypothetical protein